MFNDLVAKISLIIKQALEFLVELTLGRVVLPYMVATSQM